MQDACPSNEVQMTSHQLQPHTLQANSVWSQKETCDVQRMLSEGRGETRALCRRTDMVTAIRAGVETGELDEYLSESWKGVKDADILHESQNESNNFVDDTTKESIPGRVEQARGSG